MKMDWTKHSTSRMNTSVTEFTADLPDGYGLQLHRYKSYVTDEFINEWAIWKENWLSVVHSGVIYGTLENAKQIAEQAARDYDAKERVK